MLQKIFASILVISSILLCIGIIALAAISTYNNDENKYNNGICSSCGGHYHLTATDHGRFFYQCEKCKSTIEVGHLIEKKIKVKSKGGNFPARLFLLCAI